jgi:hypothetical protein
MAESSIRKSSIFGWILVSNQRTCIARWITLPGYNFSSQAIDVPLEAKISHGVLNNT